MNRKSVRGVKSSDFWNNFDVFFLFMDSLHISLLQGRLVSSRKLHF